MSEREFWMLSDYEKRGMEGSTEQRTIDAKPDSITRYITIIQSYQNSLFLLPGM